MRNETKQITNYLKSIGVKSIATHSQRFFKTGKGQYGYGDIFIGIRVPMIRKQIKSYKSVDLTIAQELLKSPYHEVRLFALLLLVENFKKATEKQQKKIFKLYITNTEYINNWDLVDLSASQIVGKYLLKNKKNILEELAKSDNLWDRRIAIISTYAFIKENEFEWTIKIAIILKNDNHDLIHKAVGWMLREVGKKSLSTEENFLKKFYKTMPRTMLRYAIEKFPEPKRKAYLKGTI